MGIKIMKQRPNKQCKGISKGYKALRKQQRKDKQLLKLLFINQCN